MPRPVGCELAPTFQAHLLPLQHSSPLPCRAPSAVAPRPRPVLYVRTYSTFVLYPCAEARGNLCSGPAEQRGTLAFLMRPALMMALATLASLVAPADAGSTTMCKDDNDFVSGSTSVLDTGMTCEQWKTQLLTAQYFDKPAWSDVTCDVARAAGYGAVFAPPYPQFQWGPLFHLLRIGKVCCGGLQKTICYDSTNMCKTDTDFNPTASPGGAPRRRAKITCSIFSTILHQLPPRGTACRAQIWPRSRLEMTRTLQLG